MCGFIGFFDTTGFSLKSDDIAFPCLNRRGPDSSSFYSDPLYQVKHYRLSINDLSESGDQPFSYNGVVLVANGEIYNSNQLRSELSSYPYVSTSDCEVILAGYLEWGMDYLLSRLNGIFAFSIYDSRTFSLYLCRDFLGVKPLFYSIVRSCLVYSSTINSLASLQPVTMSPDAQLEHLALGYIGAPKTLYNEILSVEPGEYILYNDSNLHKIKYWNLKDVLSCHKYSFDQHTFENLITQSVRRQSKADVAISLAYSGGLDSSCLLNELQLSGADELHLFSIDLPHHTQIPTPRLRFNDKLIRLRIPEEEYIQNFNDLSLCLGQPLADFSSLNCLSLFKVISKTHKVVLMGDGPDELLFGYPRLRQLYISLLLHKYGIKRLHDSILNSRSELLGNPIPSRSLLDRYSSLLGTNYSFTDFIDSIFCEDLSAVENIISLQFSYLANDLLFRTDATSMFYGVEARVPFLDQEVVTYVLSSNCSSRFFPLNLKYPLKSYFRSKHLDYLPRKQGFSSPPSIRSLITPFCRPLHNSELSRYSFGLPLVEQYE